MIILEDTRQKPSKNAHIVKQLEDRGYTVQRTKLYCGDYTFPTNQSICVDTKKDLQEVVGNLTKQHERFKQECIRAKESGIKLVILIQDQKIKELAQVFGWYNPRLRVSKGATTGRTLARIMYAMKHKYGVEWKFCTRETVGMTIVDILEGTHERK